LEEEKEFRECIMMIVLNNNFLQAKPNSRIKENKPKKKERENKDKKI